MKGYCENCNAVIDETETYTVNHLVVCHDCFDKLEGNKVISFGTWKKMTRKERKASRKDMTAYEMFHEANKDKECVICGMNNSLYEIHRINDGKYCYDGETVLLCGNCISNNNPFDDLFQVASNVFIKGDGKISVKSKPKPYLCSICRLRDICIDFDYECVEASDFLYRKGDKDDYKRVVKELEEVFVDNPRVLKEIKKVFSEGGNKVKCPICKGTMKKGSDLIGNWYCPTCLMNEAKVYKPTKEEELFYDKIGLPKKDNKALRG